MSDKPIIPASDDFIYIEAIQTNLVDINLTDAEIVERAELDSMASNMKPDDDRPVGKQVK